MSDTIYKDDDNPLDKKPGPQMRPPGRTGDYEGSDPPYERVDRMNTQEVLNMELFYNQQITNLNMSWVLRHSKTNLRVVGITQEHTYGFSVNNQYNNGIGGAASQAINSFINATQGKLKEFGPIAEQAGTWAESMKSTSSDLIGGAGGEDNQNRTFGQSVQYGIGKAVEMGSDALNWIHDNYRDNNPNSFKNKITSLFFKGGGPSPDVLANGKMISSTDKVMTYGGSDLSITLPTLKTYVFHNPITDKHNVLDLTSALADVICPKTSRSSIKGLYALQHAPGGFVTSLNAFDGQTNPMDGTWELTFNGYTIKNLLVSNMVVNYSKYNAMNKSGEDSGDPLYAEIDLTLAMASMLTSDEVIDIMTGANKKKNGEFVTNNRVRYKSSGWDDSDMSIKGVTSKSGDVAVIGTNRTFENDRYTNTSYL